MMENVKILITSGHVYTCVYQYELILIIFLILRHYKDSDFCITFFSLFILSMLLHLKLKSLFFVFFFSIYLTKWSEGGRSPIQHIKSVQYMFSSIVLTYRSHCPASILSCGNWLSLATLSKELADFYKLILPLDLHVKKLSQR